MIEVQKMIGVIELYDHNVVSITGHDEIIKYKETHEKLNDLNKLVKHFKNVTKSINNTLRFLNNRLESEIVTKLHSIKELSDEETI